MGSEGQRLGYLTGAGRIASGLGVLLGVLPRVAAWAEARQITLYTLVWLSALIAGHSGLASIVH